MLTKQEILLGRTRFYGDGINFQWPLANHSNSESFLVAEHCSAKIDASEKDSGKWTDTWCLLSTFPELFRLVVAY